MIIIVSRGFTLIVFSVTTIFRHNMTSYNKIGRKPVVNSASETRKTLQNKGNLRDTLECRETSKRT